MRERKCVRCVVSLSWSLSNQQWRAMMRDASFAVTEFYEPNRCPHRKSPRAKYATHRLVCEFASLYRHQLVWTCDFSYDYVKINADYRS